MKIVESQDVFCMVIPEEMDAGDTDTLRPLLAETALAWVQAQWAGGGPAPFGVQMTNMDWHITDKVFEVDEFQPAHDCEECRSGNEKAKAFLRANPGRFIAMANLSYCEIWAGS